MLAYLAEKPHEDGDLARAIEVTLESAAIAGEVDWTWWQFLRLHGAADLELQRGNLDAAERHALAALGLSLSLGNRRSIMLVAAKLAVIAAERGDAERAGRLWGAIESNETAGHRWTGIRPGANRGPPAVDRRSGRPRLAPAGLTPWQRIEPPVLGAQSRTQLRHHIFGIWVAAEHRLREDKLSPNVHVEDAAPTRYELDGIDFG